MKSIFLIPTCCLLLLCVTFSNCKKKDDGGPKNGISVSEVTAFEDEEVIVSVKLQNAASKTVSVHYAAEDGTAKLGDDYLAMSGDLTFAPGETEQTITMAIVADSIREGDEYFYVKLTDAVNAQIVTAVGRVTLRNDDTFVPLPNAGFDAPTTYPGYQMKWSDEFNGTTLNTNNWVYEIGDGCPNCGWGNNELQSYTNSPQNLFMNNGSLIIEARRENTAGKNYSSARIKTQGKQSFKFGRIDIRSVMPVGQGIWPAIWMLGDNITTASWPACGEIDIMEYLGHEPNYVHGTGHWGVNFASHQYKGNFLQSQGDDFTQAWHVFSIIWKQDEITWLVDDQPFFTLNPGVTGPSYPFNNSFFFILNMAVGGNWPGNPDGTTVFPQRFAVDYVRVFEEI